MKNKIIYLLMTHLMLFSEYNTNNQERIFNTNQENQYNNPHDYQEESHSYRQNNHRNQRQEYCDCAACRNRSSNRNNKKTVIGIIGGGTVGAGIGAAVATKAGTGALIGGPIGMGAGYLLSKVL